MKKFKMEFEMTISVEFCNPEKTLSYLQGDWSNHFYAFYDLEDVAEFLSKNFNIHDEYFKDGKFIKDIEGFPDFVRTNNKWTASFEELGKIIIHVEDELDIACTSEVD